MTTEEKALKLADVKSASEKALEDDDLEMFLRLAGEEIRLISSLQEDLLGHSVIVVNDPRAKSILRDISLDGLIKDE